MVEYAYNIWNKVKSKQEVLMNMSHLGLTNVVNLAAPLLIAPHIIQYCGLGQYGRLSLALGILFIFIVITDFGFNLYGPKSMVEVNGDKKQLSILLSRILGAKFLLFIAASILILIVISFFYHQIFIKGILVGIIISLLGKAYNLNWFFLGLQRNGIFFWLTVLVKGVCVWAIFAFVHDKEDIDLVLCLLGGSDLALFLFAMLYLYFFESIQCVIVTMSSIVFTLRGSWNIFLTNLVLSATNNSYIAIIGLILSPEKTAVFAIADRVLNILKTIAGILFQTFYSKAILLAKQNLEDYRHMLWNYFRFSFLLFIVFGSIIFMSSNEIAKYFTVESMEEVQHLLQIGAFIPLVITTNSAAYMTLIIFERHKSYFIPIFVGWLVCIVTCYSLVSGLQLRGAILAMYITELWITIALNIAAYRYLNYQTNGNN